MENEHQREREIFTRAYELTARAERNAYLAEACGSDESLRRRIEQLIETQAEAEAFIKPEEIHVDDGERRTTSGASAGPSEAPLEEPLGSVVGRYRLVELLGEGGFGRVYRAEQIEPVHRVVALKIIKAGMNTREVVARFEAERQALALMDHPNVARVLDAGATETGRPFFVMEMVHGVSITAYCDQQRLTLRERLTLFIPVCRAVQHAHQKGIIHRDLKPSNILVDQEGGTTMPKVIDFGVAKALHEPLGNQGFSTRLGQMVGTPVYMSPEQAEFGGADLDTRSDIYSLGVVLYELLTGKPPFDFDHLCAAGYTEMLRILREEEPLRPSTRLGRLGTDLASVAQSRQVHPKRLPALLRGDLDWIVMKALEKERARRYETASALAEDLERHLRDQPVAAGPPHASYRLRKFIRRHRHASAAAAGIVLASLVGLAATTVGFLQAKQERDHALGAEHRADQEWRMAVQEGQRARLGEQRARQGERRARQIAYASDLALAQQALAKNNLGHALVLLNRQRPAADQEDLRGWEWRYLWQQCRSDALFTLGEHADSISSITCSSDGRYIASASRDGAVKVWEFAARQLVRERPEVDAMIAYSPKSPMLATGCRLGGIKLWDSTLGTEIAWLRQDSHAGGLAFSGDGNLVGAILESEKLALWDVATREPAGSYDGMQPSGFHGSDLVIAPDGRWVAVGDKDGAIRLLEARTGRTLRRFPAHPESITALAVSPDGRCLATGAGFSDPTVRLWQVETGEPKGILTGHSAWVSALTFTPDGQTLVSASADQTLRVWDLHTTACATVLRGHQHEVWALACLPDGKTAVSGAKDGVINVWRIEPAPASLVATHVAALDGWVTPDGNGMFLVDDTSSVVRCRLPAFEQVQRIEALGSNVTACAFSASRRLLAVADRDGLVRVWDESRGLVVTNLARRHAEPGVIAVRFTPVGNYLIAVEHLRLVRVWNCDDWREVAWWESTNRPLPSLDFSPAGDYLVAGGGGMHDVVVYALLTGQSVARLPDPRLTSDAVAFSPDGRIIATCGEYGLANLWEVGTWRALGTLRGHLLGVHCLAFSPDGKRLATGSVDREAIKIWDMATRQELLTLSLPGESLRRLRFSPDGHVLLGFGAVNGLHFWRAPTWAEIAAAEPVAVPKPAP